jgi:hypothetical protein
MYLCMLCNGESYLLGQLGFLSHFRCRNCGADSSVEMDEYEENEETENTDRDY